MGDTELYYREVGEGLPCLVMHGGLGLDHSYLHPGLDPLGDVLRLVYYDHRGHGRSGRPPLASLTYERLADDADALRERLGHERVAVLGHSIGGVIALLYALRYPGRVSRLILVEAAPAFDYGPEIEANVERRNPSPEMREARAAPAPTTDEELLRQMQALVPLYFHDYDAAVADRLFGGMILNAAVFAREVELRPSFDITERLGEIRAPTLVVVGDEDFVTPPSQARRIQAGIPGAELVVVERCGHFPYAERPDAFFGAVHGWLARVA